MNSFYDELKAIINKYSKENESNTPDFILAEYLNECLILYSNIITKRENYFKNYLNN